jgi:hypothetical protein
MPFMATLEKAQGKEIMILAQDECYLSGEAKGIL